MAGQLNVIESLPPSEVDIVLDPKIAELQLWPEAFFGFEMLLLRASPVFYGFGRLAAMAPEWSSYRDSWVPMCT